MKKTFTLIAMMLTVMLLSAQTVTLTFSGRDANGFERLPNHVVVKNLTKGWEKTIYDNVLTLQNDVGIEDVASENVFALSQNNPNPFDGTTFATLQMPEHGNVMVEIADVNGRIVETRFIASLQPGAHQLRVSLATAGVYFLTVRQAGRTSSVKMVCRNGGGANAVAYDGMVDKTSQLKNAPKSSIIKPFDYGDRMEYVGYASSPYEVSHTVTQALDTSDEEIVLHFDGVRDGIACPGFESVTDYEGNSYSTVRIGRQCWTKENMRTTHFADGTTISLGDNVNYYQSLNTPYYHNYSSSSIPLSKRGYLYNFYATRSYTGSSSDNPSGVQGVCPNGWHEPSVAEWEQLMNYVKSRDEYLCAGGTNNFAKALAANSSYWTSSTIACSVGNNPTSNNATGLSLYPSGAYFIDELGGNGVYLGTGDRSYLCTTDTLLSNNGRTFFFMQYNDVVADYYTGSYSRQDAFAVRCLCDFDHEATCPVTNTVTDYDGNLYNTVQIGSQCWMKQNLRSRHYSDGSAIPTDKYWDNTNSSLPLYKRGYLYSADAMMRGRRDTINANPSGLQGVCPVGWHVPSDAEWAQLCKYVGNQRDYLCGVDSVYFPGDMIAKSLADKSGWQENSSSSYPCYVFCHVDENNSTGFSAYPAGYYNGNSTFVNHFFDDGQACKMWSCTRGGNPYTNNFVAYSLYSYRTYVVKEDYSNYNYGISVRCLRD